MPSPTQSAAKGQHAVRRKLEIDFLFLDLNTCARCVGTDENLTQALNAVEEVLQFTGVEVNVNKILIDSTEKARAHRFVTSPTIRVNGHDLALETEESKCDSCTDLCGCAEGTNCRVWTYRGQKYTEAPVAMVVEAILQEVYRPPQPLPLQAVFYDGAPENLERFFTGVSAKAVSSCCSTEKQQTCCEPSEKSACCGENAGQSCGCQ